MKRGKKLHDLFSSENDSEFCIIFKTETDAIIPKRMSCESVGYDLYSTESHWIFPLQHRNIDTGIGCIPPSNCYCRITGRSGLANKHGLFVGAEVIDPDYRGSIRVLLFNCSLFPVRIKKFSRVGQMVFEVCKTPTFVALEAGDKKMNTQRGKRGLGSTGI